MNRVTIFAHYDAKGEIKPYILQYLEALRRECSSIAFVSTANLSAAELDKTRPYCDSAVVRENVGYDFGMWQHVLASLDLTNVTELLLTNSSIFGPLYPLGPIFAQMSARPCDFWGMTDSYEISSHLQSYFLLFKRSVLASVPFREFFRSILPYRDKDQVIRSYEIGLTKFLVEAGFKAEALVPMGSWIASAHRRERLCKRRRNATVFYPMELLEAGMPLVKVQLLRDNPAGVRLRRVLKAMERAGYDMSKVQF